MPMLAAAGVAVGGSLLQGYMNSRANDEQTAASKEALQMQLDAVREERARQMGAATQANQLLDEGYNTANSTLLGSLAGARNDLQLGFNDAQRSLGQMYGIGRQDLQAGDQLAMSRLGAGVNAAQATLDRTAGNSRLAALMNGGLAAGFQADPGYAFRQRQGEQALQRGAAAAGGRIGTRSLQSLANFNSGLASQEFGNYANRAIGMAQSEDARQAALMGQLAQMQYGGGLQGANFANSMGQNLGRAAFEQGSNLSNLATGRGGALSSLGMQGGTALANLAMSYGQQQGANLLSGAGASAALTQSMLGEYSNPVRYAGASTAAMGQGVGAAADNAAQYLAMYGMMSKGA